MKKAFGTIREGFLRAIGAGLLTGLVSVFALGGVSAIGLLSRSNTATRIWAIVCVLLAASFALVWLIYWRRVQLLRVEVSYLRSGILIHSARYGAGDKKCDVAPYIERQIGAGCRKIPVGNSLLDGADDPCPNAKKAGVVEYSRAGKRQTQTVQEDGGCFDFSGD